MVSFTEAQSQDAVVKLTLQERRDALTSALANLSLDDRTRIVAMANIMVDAMKAKHPGIGFSQEAALEAIAAVGIFLFRRMK